MAKEQLCNKPGTYILRNVNYDNYFKLEVLNAGLGNFTTIFSLFVSRSPQNLVLSAPQTKIFQFSEKNMS
jgi:hypothetical protein